MTILFKKPVGNRTPPFSVNSAPSRDTSASWKRCAQENRRLSPLPATNAPNMPRVSPDATLISLNPLQVTRRRISVTPVASVTHQEADPLVIPRSIKLISSGGTLAVKIGAVTMK